MRLMPTRTRPSTLRRPRIRMIMSMATTVAAGMTLAGFLTIGALVDQVGVGLLGGVAAIAVVGLSFALLGTPRLLVPSVVYRRREFDV